jgi:hypothetical protein
MRNPREGARSWPALVLGHGTVRLLRQFPIRGVAPGASALNELGFVLQRRGRKVTVAALKTPASDALDFVLQDGEALDQRFGDR